jgi:hypothetical protein
MGRLSKPTAVARSVILVSLLGAAAIASAQVRLRAAPAVAAPPATTAISHPVLPGAPSSNGLSSPFPASVTPPSVPGTSTGMGNVNEPGAPNTGQDVMEPQAVAVVGAGAYGTRGLTRPMPGGPISDVDIARSFMNADTDHDGDLTRGEAARLSILPLAFEEMDANHDDILTRSEYENAVR